jgi:hypothetical protein
VRPSIGHYSDEVASKPVEVIEYLKDAGEAAGFKVREVG